MLMLVVDSSEGYFLHAAFVPITFEFVWRTLGNDVRILGTSGHLKSAVFRSHL